jgi:hypothetical protein
MSRKPQKANPNKPSLSRQHKDIASGKTKLNPRERPKEGVCFCLKILILQALAEPEMTLTQKKLDFSRSGASKNKERSMERTVESEDDKVVKVLLHFLN